ncbi:hypothetical protein MHBO_001187 [Bonamia ostreae]|uniref:Uncharacterized protein n=1 Tax=Bonamia ostreae TaxID=126728 RepID=A0ABV2AI25_9EUKA
MKSAKRIAKQLKRTKTPKSAMSKKPSQSIKTVETNKKTAKKINKKERRRRTSQKRSIKTMSNNGDKNIKRSVKKTINKKQVLSNKNGNKKSMKKVNKKSTKKSIKKRSKKSIKPKKIYDSCYSSDSDPDNPGVSSAMLYYNIVSAPRAPGKRKIKARDEAISTNIGGGGKSDDDWEGDVDEFPVMIKINIKGKRFKERFE